MRIKYLEFIQRFAVFDEAAFLNYARTLGGIVDEDDHGYRCDVDCTQRPTSAQPSRE
ncbi:hypothetical protein [Bradyrhizobium sp. CCGUVB23]|uniref:hypothetical protein n=1 Tax=Bradyrhizobium sp. CCGUVB23 TaxID=2949630 RepID=UPI0020B1F270|nr:hypothetical protein [Bradyrhizobium sp. CCGUVB23]MCP3459162.1 hypothetical protein [Bradyrhizobium sp. CCGUVB23]